MYFYTRYTESGFLSTLALMGEAKSSFSTFLGKECYFVSRAYSHRLSAVLRFDIHIVTEESNETELVLFAKWLEESTRSFSAETPSTHAFVDHIHSELAKFAKLVSITSKDCICEIDDDGLKQLKREMLAQELQK